MVDTNDPPEAVSVTIVNDHSNNNNTTPQPPPPPEASPQPQPPPPSPSPIKEDPVGKKENSKSTKMNPIIFPITLISFLLSLPVLFVIVWLLYVRSYNCEGLIKLPKLQLGITVGLVFVFLISNLVVYLRSRFPIPGLLIAMLPLIVMLTVGLALIGAFKMESTSIPGSPLWIKMKVINNNNWNNIKSCIYDTRTCDDLVSRSYALKSYDFTTSKLSPIEYGCCKPPASCEMEYVNATYWKIGNKVMDSNNPYDNDCKLWENEESSLCYNCYACKQGFLRTLQSKWGKLGVFLVIMSLLLILAHLLLFVTTMWESYK
ncbi:hypothetical protein LguiB_010566 [Lonicera macranthoides]